MLVQKEYVAVTDFLLNLDNGKNTINVKRGDSVLFDGLVAEHGGIKGQAHSLVKTIGEWIVLKGHKGAVRNTKAPMVSRNLTGGKILENSNVEADPEARIIQNKDDYSELQSLLAENDKKQETLVSDNMQDIRREVKVINEDATIVRQVTQTDTTGVKNTSGVELSDQKETKRPVISSEERVVKETNYDGNQKAAAEAPKRLPVEKDGDGVEVRKVTKVSAPAKAAVTKHEVSREEDAVLETSYDNNKHTDVKSSTQKQVETPKSTKKPVQKAAVSKPELHQSGRRVVVQEQEAVVVRKVSRDGKLDLAQGTVQSEEGDTVNIGGIISKVTVGAPSDMEVGDVHVGSSGDMDVGDVEFASTEDTAVDAGAEGADIDINDILDKQ